MLSKHSVIPWYLAYFIVSLMSHAYCLFLVSIHWIFGWFKIGKHRYKLRVCLSLPFVILLNDSFCRYFNLHKPVCKQLLFCSKKSLDGRDWRPCIFHEHVQTWTLHTKLVFVVLSFPLFGTSGDWVPWFQFLLK